MAPSGKDDRTFWVWSQLDEALHTALLEVSTATGKHPRALIEIAIEEYIVRWTSERSAKGLSVSPHVQFEVIMLEDRTRQIRLNQLKQLAFNHVEHPTDDSAEQLASACDLAGISVESILQQVSNKPHVVELMGENGSLNSVEMFLAMHIEPGNMYSASDVIAAGEKKGFKKYLINEAKRKLGIQSRKEGSAWLWFIPEKKKGEQQEEEKVF